MKTLDRYIVRTFLTNVVLLFVVMMMLRIVADLFINIDEFANVEAPGIFAKVLHVFRYYAYQSTTYFIELGGVIIVAAATFSLASMNHSNELTAILASGVSLHRVTMPIIICAMVMGGLIILDQELVVPRVAYRLSLHRDEAPESAEFKVEFVTDGAHTVWYASRYHSGKRRMTNPVILIRDSQYNALGRITGEYAVPCELDGQTGWSVFDAHLAMSGTEEEIWRTIPSTDRICSNVTPLEFLEQARLDYRRQSSGKDTTLSEITKVTRVNLHDAAYGMQIRADLFIPELPSEPDSDNYGGRLEKPSFTFSNRNGRILGRFIADSARWERNPERGEGQWQLHEALLFYPSDMTAEDLVLRQSSDWLDYISTSDVAKVAQVRHLGDDRAAQLVKHVRFTAPINNLIMLLLGLPFILSRERNIKASATMCLLTVGTFFLLVYICRHLGISPLLAAWVPIFLFGPLAIILLDSVKT